MKSFQCWVPSSSSVRLTRHSHGEIERQHRIINELQRNERILYQGRFPNILARWDEYAKHIQFMLNTAVVERHGMCPLYFSFGRQPRLPAPPDQGLEGGVCRASLSGAGIDAKVAFDRSGQS
jgi:hypothetical protein